MSMKFERNGLEVAVIGLSGRFPGSDLIEVFWENLTNGSEFISTFSRNGSRQKIQAGAVLDKIDLFDADFFDFSPKDAEIIDPQHRLLLECAWEALENAGCDSAREERPIGVYAGIGSSTYSLYNLSPNHLKESLGFFPTLLACDRDYAPTRVSYKLNLTGPSISIGTACSSSLVAVHLAYKSLLSGECDIALAAGISVKTPQNEVTLCPEGISPDGRCFAFDARANGTIGGNGVGVVVLKRLEDAIADRDFIYSVIKGAAINNDGAFKVSYTAPSENAQASVIRAAQIMADVEPETITYIETHGTGTPMGDPIEIAALKQVFPREQKHYCAIGSVKTNIGHLDAAAGIVGFIKTVLALHHKVLPPSLNFQTPNPQIDFENSPFYVNDRLAEWNSNGTPRRAGVSSFGFGGTNAHVILEEAPPPEPSAVSRSWQLLLLSAKTDSALETTTANLLEHLTQHPDLNLADVAYTLQIGRRGFSQRRMVVCQSVDDAVKALQDPKRVLSNRQETSDRPVAFMFTGLGTHYVNMGWELYQNEPIFHECVDRCCELLKPLLGMDLKDILYPSQSQSSDPSPPTDESESSPRSQFDLRKMLGRDLDQPDAATQALNQTSLTQPAMFVVEYALAQVWMAWGIRPIAMIGYSIGEYVAACLSGVLSLEDALTLVAKRAQMIQALPDGAMLAVPLSEEAVCPLLGETLSLSAVNGPSLCVVSGAIDAIAELEHQLVTQGLACRRLQTSHAFHSVMMEAIADSFTELAKTVTLQPPQIPYLSNVTGTWITAAQATDPGYWTTHLCQPVRFADGVKQLWQQQHPILLEIGPGQTLSSLVLQCLADEQGPDQVVLPSLCHSFEKQSDFAFLLNTLGQLWLSGCQIDWSGFYAHENRHRLPLPTYPFERQRYWIDPPNSMQLQSAPSGLWRSLVTAGQQQANQEVSQFDEQTYLEQVLWMDRLCTAYINQAVRRLGAFNDPSEQYSFEELFEHCQIIPHYRQLWAHWLQILVEQGHLQQDEQGVFSNLLPVSADSIHSLVEEVSVRWADSPEPVEILQRCGENLTPVLVGEKSASEFQVAKLAKKEEVPVQRLPSIRYCKAILRTILEQLVQSISPEVNLRLLEIGGGQGIATNDLLAVLPPERSHYSFTDVGGWLLSRAEKKYSHFPFVDCRLLDIEQSPTEQGYSAHSFDVVIVVNVLHVLQNVGEALDHIRSLLAPGGLLLIWEITQPQLLFDLADGLLINPLEDEGRDQGNPFLSKDQWQAALYAHGFVEVSAFSKIEPFGQDILVAQVDSKAAPLTPAAFTVLAQSKNVEQDSQGSFGKRPDIADWFYLPSWKRSILSSKSIAQTGQSQRWLVFVDEFGLGTQFVKRLHLADQEIVIVNLGENFSSEYTTSSEGYNQRAYTINPRHPNDYNTLFKELRALSWIPTAIMHFWSVTPNRFTGSEDTTQALGFHSLLFLVQAIADQNLTDSLEIGIVSNNMQPVTGSEELIPEKALLLGPCKVIPLEYPNITCRSVDIVLPEPNSWQIEELVDQLLAEFTTQTTDPIVAYRGVHRWVQTFEPARLEAVDQEPCLREAGVYLITGGLGSVSLTVADYLARAVKAKLILTGRSPFPARAEWSHWLSTHDQQDDISQKIRKIQDLEELGSEVLVLSADVTDYEQMSAAISQITDRFGQIHGVIHAAFVPRGGMIQRRTEDFIGAELGPKVRGTQVLDRLFKDTKLDFFLLFSSIYAFEPLVGQVDYVAESAFLDAFAHYSICKRPGTVFISINWDGWSGLGSAVSFAAKYEELTGEPIRDGMLPEEGIEALRRILSTRPVPQIVLSTHDLLTLLTTDSEQKLSLSSLQKTGISKPARQRPELKNSYVAPTSELEIEIAESFQKFLGFEQIGIHDNFFALGGDSLTGSVLVKQLCDRFEIDLRLRVLYEAPTVAELAVAIEKILIEELATLTEEEASLILER